MSLSASVCLSVYLHVQGMSPESSLGIHASGFVSGPNPQALPSPTPHAAVGVTLQPAGLCKQLTPRLLAPGPAPAAAPLYQVSPPPPHTPRETLASPRSFRAVQGPATPTTSHRAQLPRPGLGGARATQAGGVPSADGACPPATLTQRRAHHESQQRPHGRARRWVRRARRQAMGPGGDWPGRGRGSCCWGGAPPRSGYRRGPSPGARRAGIPAARQEARDAACARATGRIQAAATPAWLRTLLALRLPALGCGPRAPAHCSGGPGGRRETEEGGGSGRGRDESPRGEGAAAQPLPQRPGRRPGTGLSCGFAASVHLLHGLGHSDFARLSGVSGPFPLPLLRKVISRPPRGLGGQFEGPISIFLIIEVNLIQFLGR